MIDSLLENLSNNCPYIDRKIVIELEDKSYCVYAGVVSCVSLDDEDVRVRLDTDTLLKAVANPQSLLKAYVEGEVEITGDSKAVAYLPLIFEAML